MKSRAVAEMQGSASEAEKYHYIKGEKVLAVARRVLSACKVEPGASVYANAIRH